MWPCSSLKTRPTRRGRPQLARAKECKVPGQKSAADRFACNGSKVDGPHFRAWRGNNTWTRPLSGAVFGRRSLALCVLFGRKINRREQRQLPMATYGNRSGGSFRPSKWSARSLACTIERPAEQPLELLCARAFVCVRASVIGRKPKQQQQPAAAAARFAANAQDERSRPAANTRPSHDWPVRFAKVMTTTRLESSL